jgi:hypothetical protein
MNALTILIVGMLARSSQAEACDIMSAMSSCGGVWEHR